MQREPDLTSLAAIGFDEGPVPLRERLERLGARSAKSVTDLHLGRSVQRLPRCILLRGDVLQLMQQQIEIRESPLLAAIPTLCVLPEGANKEVDVAACLRAGAFACFVEPLEIEVLEQILRSVLGMPSDGPIGTSEGPLPRGMQFVQELVLSLRTVEEAELAAAFLADACPQPARQALGIVELLLNAIEHGNLEIDEATKARLVREGQMQAEVARRAADPHYSGRHVTVWLRRFPDQVEFVCEDQGQGFDWRGRLSAIEDDVRSEGVAGRGIALAQKLSFDSLEYTGRGNVVIGRALAERRSRHPDPAAFSHEISSWERHLLETEAGHVLDRVADERFFHQVLALALRVSESRSGVIGYLNEEGDLMVPAHVRSAMSEPEDDRPRLIARAELCRSWTRILEERIVLIDNEGSCQLGPGAALERGLGVPIVHRGQTLGILQVADRALPYGWREAQRLETVARRLAPSLAARIQGEIARQGRAELQRERSREKEEHELARHLVSGLIKEGCLDGPGIRGLFSSKDLFNGDLALAAALPNGGLRWMLGDFVGHGLPAAIGGLPVASVFYATARKGVPLEEVVVTMNGALHSQFPAGFFCAATLLEVSAEADRLQCWNGGMPAVLVRSADGTKLRHIHSAGVPLGVVSSQGLEAPVTTLDTERGDQVLCMSDGLLETRNAEGELFGVERALAALSEATGDSAFDALLEAARAFRGAAPDLDDVSLLEVILGVAGQLEQTSPADTAAWPSVRPGPSQRPPPDSWSSTGR